MKISTKIYLSAPAEKAWEVLGDKFGDFGLWTSSLTSSKLNGNLGVGAVRTCQTPGFGPFAAAVVKERLVEFNPKEKRYTYVVESGLPAIFKNVKNSWSIESIDNKNCIIHSYAVAELSFWLRPFSWVFPLLIKRDLNKTFEEMSYFIEKGKVHPRKIKASSEKT